MVQRLILRTIEGDSVKNYPDRAHSCQQKLSGHHENFEDNFSSTTLNLQVKQVK